MSWSILAVPLHDALTEVGLAWAKSASYTHGLPDEVPPAQPRPLVTDVLAAFRTAGCHGTAWFAVDGMPTGDWLPDCPDPAACRAGDGLDLGEVTLQVVGPAVPGAALAPDASVEAVSFRSPAGAAALHAIAALTATAGPLLAFDDTASAMVVIRPEDEISSLAPRWPW